MKSERQVQKKIHLNFKNRKRTRYEKGEISIDTAD